MAKQIAPAGVHGDIGMQAAPLRALIALVLALLTLVSSGCRAQPGSAGTGAARGGETPALQHASRLQEVGPPGAVPVLSERLAAHQPRVEIVAPADDALLPEGPWTLQLRVSDWPLSDSEGLGIGPHLVVQLDQQPPLQLSSTEAAAAVAMPPLQPGSHRLTVYAARPWGEAVKSPGALRQIRLHRVGRNSAELPARGSAQLIVASPADAAQQEPVLLDWLLLDAPLQHLQSDDARWRLRVSVNGDSVLVDRQTPLWLKGFQPGSNAVQLELLDARGEALNPPFNSLVREVVISSAARPAWRNPKLSPGQLALLSGEAPPADQAEAAPAAAQQPAQPAAPQAEPAPAPQPEPEPEPEPESAAEPGSEPDSEPDPRQAPPPQPPEPEQAAAAESAAPAQPEPDASTAPPSPETVASSSEEPTVTAAEQPVIARPAPPSARDLVNADGSLVQPKARGPLAGLREKLGG